MFVNKLVKFMNECDKDICDWSDDGLKVIVLNNAEFEKNIRCVSQTIASFVRQLNNYGFVRLKLNETQWMFGHKYFIKNKPKLYSRIDCSKKYNPLRFTHLKYRRTKHSKSMIKISPPQPPQLPVLNIDYNSYTHDTYYDLYSDKILNEFIFY